MLNLMLLGKSARNIKLNWGGGVEVKPYHISEALFSLSVGSRLNFYI